MAQGLRTRQLALTLSLALLGCGEEEEPEHPAPEESSADYSDPDELVSAVLETCHGPLRGMHSVILSLEEDGAGTARNVSLSLPDRMRVVSGEVAETLRGGEAWRKHPDGQLEGLVGAELARLRDLRDLLGGMLLYPLYKRSAVTPAGTGFLVELEDGERWHLELREGTLLPASLRGEAGEVVFLEYRRTSMTWIPMQVVLGQLGKYRIRFQSQDVAYGPGFFDELPLDTGAIQAQIAPGAVLTTGVPRPETPELIPIAASFWLELDDPGDWQRRHELVKKALTALSEQQQELMGFPGFVVEDDRRLLVVPFVPATAGGKPFESPGQTVRELADHHALVVYPEPGPFEYALESGSAMLRDYARRNRLETDGEIVAYPYLKLGTRAPTEEDVATVILRLELPVK